jgi:hypothetical protein
MVETVDHSFDAKSEAAHIEHLAQVYLQALGDNKNSTTTTYSKAAKNGLIDALVPVFRDEQHGKQIGIRVEKIRGRYLQF